MIFIVSFIATIVIAVLILFLFIIIGDDWTSGGAI